MKRSPDLLVKERVLAVILNGIIRTDGDFAKNAGTLVLIELEGGNDGPSTVVPEALPRDRAR